VEGGKDEKIKKMREKVEQTQALQQKRILRELEPKCWEKLAEQGYFQKAEDSLNSAAALECEENGESERYARLLHAVGALYDFRSNSDVTGQQQALSIVSAKYCCESAKALRVIVSARGDTCERELTSLLAAVLLLRGRSLCNSALDGDVPDMTVDVQFSEAHKDLDEATALRETSGSLQGEGLAESVMAVGYLWYCKAGRLVNQKGYSNRKKLLDGSGLGPEELAVMYKKALENYNRSLALYISSVGEEHTDSVRMMCNAALVFNTWSKVPDDMEQRRERMVQGEEAYKHVLEIQERVFGNRHPRTLRIKQDLGDLQKRKAVLDGLAPDVAPVLDDEDRRKEADDLMEEFLNERRKERKAERQEPARPPVDIDPLATEGWNALVDINVIPGASDSG